jgi:hypothetical protein
MRNLYPSLRINGRVSLLALGYESKQILREKRKNANYAEDTVTATGSK